MIHSLDRFMPLDDPELSAQEIKAHAQPRAHQRHVAKPASGAFGVARKNGDGSFEKKDNIVDNHRQEGLHQVTADKSPNGKPLLVVGHEISGTTVIYQINLKY